jgi:hypothetical protein
MILASGCAQWSLISGSRGCGRYQASVCSGDVSRESRAFLCEEAARPPLITSVVSRRRETPAAAGTVLGNQGGLLADHRDRIRSHRSPGYARPATRTAVPTARVSRGIAPSSMPESVVVRDRATPYRFSYPATSRSRAEDSSRFDPLNRAQAADTRRLPAGCGALSASFPLSARMA